MKREFHVRVHVARQATSADVVVIFDARVRIADTFALHVDPRIDPIEARDLIEATRAGLTDALEERGLCAAIAIERLVVHPVDQHAGRQREEARDALARLLAAQER